ncbi:MAG: TIR domain-containing protein [Alphaproteobacteria bacterium]|nr:TIR domain-containing protein [Alphaproteobacteria bacterium]
MAGEIFISYRRADQAWAKLLYEKLQAHGIEAWYDVHVGAGEDWRLATAKALEESRIFVLLFSETASQSSDIAKELAAAVLEKKLIVPVRLENIAPKGAFLYELASRNWINAYENTEAKLEELAKGLARLVQSGAQDVGVLAFERSVAPPPAHLRVEDCRPFISTLALEGDPALSPDGKMLAYSAGADHLSRCIYVRNIARGDGIRISSGPYDDASPSWSSDGSRIAFVAQKKGEPCRIMVATVPAGEVRQVGQCLHSDASAVSWQPGTSFLYYYDRTGQIGHSLFRLDLDSGTRLQLPKAAFKEAYANSFQIILHLQCSPDGKSLLYLWGATASHQGIVVRDLVTGTERSLGQIIGSGSAAWAEDSRSVITATASGIGSTITAYPLDGTAPYRVYATTTRISRLSAGAGGVLAIEADPSRENLARALPKPKEQPEVIDAAKGRSWCPTFAPDGTLAFLSNRSSTNAIWVMKPGGPPSLLYDAGLSALFRVEYAPDGTKLAAVIAHEDGITVRILAASGAVITSFESPTLGLAHPTWTLDSKGVILFDRRVMQEVCVSLENTEQRRPVTEPPWCAIKVREKGGVFCCRIDKQGVWQIGEEPRLISAKYPIYFAPPVTFRNDELLIPDFNNPDGPRILAQPLAGGPDRVLAYAPGAFHTPTAQSRMAVNLTNGDIIYVAAMQGDTNIDLLTLSRH